MVRRGRNALQREIELRRDSRWILEGKILSEVTRPMCSERRSSAQDRQ